MTYKAAVTFEFENDAPETVLVAVTAGSPSTAASRAITAAKKARPGTRFASLVVLLEPQREAQ